MWTLQQLADTWPHAPWPTHTPIPPHPRRQTRQGGGSHTHIHAHTHTLSLIATLSCTCRENVYNAKDMHALRGLPWINSLGNHDVLGESQQSQSRARAKAGPAG